MLQETYVSLPAAWKVAGCKPLCSGVASQEKPHSLLHAPYPCTPYEVGCSAALRSSPCDCLLWLNAWDWFLLYAKHLLHVGESGSKLYRDGGRGGSLWLSTAKAASRGSRSWLETRTKFSPKRAPVRSRSRSLMNRLRRGATALALASNQLAALASGRDE